jgi:hypothetical protein
MKGLTALNEFLTATLVMLGTGFGTAWAGINEWTNVGPDGGTTGNPITAGLPPAVSILSLEFDPAGTVYGATNDGIYVIMFVR